MLKKLFRVTIMLLLVFSAEACAYNSAKPPVEKKQQTSTKIQPKQKPKPTKKTLKSTTKRNVNKTNPAPRKQKVEAVPAPEVPKYFELGDWDFYNMTVTLFYGDMFYDMFSLEYIIDKGFLLIVNVPNGTIFVVPYGWSFLCDPYQVKGLNTQGDMSPGSVEFDGGSIVECVNGTGLTIIIYTLL